jgi:hypothetical protein
MNIERRTLNEGALQRTIRALTHRSIFSVRYSAFYVHCSTFNVQRATQCSDVVAGIRMLDVECF